MNKYYDDSIIIDEERLPKMLKEYIAELKKYAEEDNDISYVFCFENFDAAIKGFVLDGKVTEKDYKLLILKYGGIY